MEGGDSISNTTKTERHGKWGSDFRYDLGKSCANGSSAAVHEGANTRTWWYSERIEASKNRLSLTGMKVEASFECSNS